MSADRCTAILKDRYTQMSKHLHSGGPQIGLLKSLQTDVLDVCRQEIKIPAETLMSA
jgi:hypothetical protein